MLGVALALCLSQDRHQAWSASATPRIQFTDVTDQAGISFRHHNGMEDGYKQIPEDEGAGAAWIDYDLDGDLDLYLINSNRLPGLRPNPNWRSALYRNNGDGTFTDVTEGTPLGTVGYGQGVAVGDYDNDGDPDLLVTFIGPDRLFRNDRDGKWTDVSEAAGVADPAWGTSAVFFDYDLDGDLDLYVVRYIKWNINNMKNATRLIKGREVKLYVRPASYPPTSDLLYRNNGDGTFTDVSAEAGITAEGNGFVGLIFDYDHDGYSDIYVANDMMENFLYHNLGNGTFEENGLLLGASHGGAGEIQNGMGGAFGDCDNDGWQDITVSNHQAEPSSLYRNVEGELFEYITDQVGLDRFTFSVLSWGVCFQDFDDDGWNDMLIGNGHVETAEEALPTGVTCPQKDLLLINTGDCRYEDASPYAGEHFSRRVWSRAVAAADWDNDGDMDAIITVNNGTPVLLRNDRPPENNWLGIRLLGRKSNRDGIGAKVTVRAGDLVQSKQQALTQGYCASHDPRMHFGLEDRDTVDSIVIEWPSGVRQELETVIPGRYIQVVEAEPVSAEESAPSITSASPAVPDAPVSGNIPEIFCPETFHDFGVVFQREKPSKVFEFVNVGTADLVIEEVKGDCFCVATLLSATTIPPGELGYVEVTHDTAGKESVNRHKVTLTTNDPLNPTVTFRVETIVVLPLTLHTETVEFGAVPQGATAERSLSFSVAELLRHDGAWIVGAATQYLRLKPVPAPSRNPGENEYLYRVLLGPNVPVGEYTESIQIRTTRGDTWRDSFVPVRFEIIPRGVPVQEQLNIVCSSDGTAEGEVALLSGEEGVFYGSPEVDVPGADCEVSLELREGKPVLRLTAVLSDPLQGTAGVIRIPASHPMVPVLEIPVRIDPSHGGS